MSVTDICCIFFLIFFFNFKGSADLRADLQLGFIFWSQQNRSSHFWMLTVCQEL